jgi:hypothetical protein
MATQLVDSLALEVIVHIQAQFVDVIVEFVQSFIAIYALMQVKGNVSHGE